MTESFKPTPEEAGVNFRKLPELPGPEGPKPTIFPRIFAEIFSRKHQDPEDLFSTLIYYRLQYSDAVVQNRAYGRWLDRLTNHIENQLEEQGFSNTRRLNDNPLVADPLTIRSDPEEKVEDLEDLDF